MDTTVKFAYQRRVAFSDTDAMGVVHHANYLRYCEEARVAWMRACDLSATHYPKDSRVLAVLNYRMWHIKPARFDDLLSVRLQVRRTSGVRIQFQYAMYINEERIAEGETLHIPLNNELKPVRPGQPLLTQLENEPWIETWLLNS